MYCLNEMEISQVSGGTKAGEVAGSCLAGAGGAALMGSIAGVATAGIGLAAFAVGGCAGGIILYYITK